MADLGNAVWRKSSRSSNQGNCVEVAFATPADPARVAVRDSKNVSGPHILFPADSWAAFLVK